MPGLLIEEARTNLCLRSDSLTTSPWVTDSGATTVLSTVIAPDGKLYFKVTPNNTGTSQRVIQSLSVVEGNVYTGSVVAKEGEYRYCRLFFSNATTWDGGAPNAVFDLRTGEATSVTNCIPHSLKLANGEWRIGITSTIAIVSQSSGLAIYPMPVPSGTFTQTVDGISGIFVTMAQFEVGEFPSSYIPTTTATATRAADNPLIADAWAQPWFNAIEGTIVIEFRRNSSHFSGGSTSGPTLIDRTNGNNGLKIHIQGTSGRIRGSKLSPSGNISAIYAGEENVGWPNTVTTTMGYGGATLSLAASGKATETYSSAAGASGTSGGMTMGVGLEGIYLNGHIRRITYFPKRLTNQQLQEMTA